MSTTILRKYRFKDVEMLTVAEILVENAIANKALLQSKRSVWADPFFEDIIAEIHHVSETYLQKDNAREMRQATRVVLGIQAKALNEMAEFKIQIEEDFKDNPAQVTEMLRLLGFTSYHKSARSGDQVAMISLLLQFKTNLNPEMADEIVSKGTARATIDNIIGFADRLIAANISQESLKGGRIIMTDEAIRNFNMIYDKVISVGKIASNFYKTDKVKQQLFSFSKIVKTLS